MLVQDQSETIEFLSGAAAYRGLGIEGPVERIETHISEVFLIGDRAFKLKRAVKFPYLDFSTPAKRKAAALAELALNRRTAPTIYLGLAAVLRGAGGALDLHVCEEEDDGGDVVEWLVAMRRFPQEALLDAMAADGSLAVATMEEVAQAVAAFHAEAAVVRRFGGASGMRHAAGGVRGAFAEIIDAAGDIFDPAAVAALTDADDAATLRLAPLLDARKAAGLVRHCHGDLHLRNIAMIEGRPAPFDCIEFSEEIASVDVLYDLAFLLMDLWHRDLTDHANATLNRYLEVTGDYEGLAALPLFLASRAAIRAHVTGTLALGENKKSAGRDAHIEEARAYLALGNALIDPPPPRLVAIGGLPGSGKTTIARALAPALLPVPGAVVLRSDVIRKTLAGVDPLTPLGPEGYSATMTARTYETLRRRAETALAAGHSVVADAVHARPHERAALEAVAAAVGVGFDGLWLDAPGRALETRVSERGADASDATVAVVRKALDYETGPIGWTRIDAGGGAQTVIALAKVALWGP
ncbi:MAG TPA: AAA family ATPase [Alphaproteobacteria bacterium]|nr:AAA family ATPase [Alphaproteobacteria bacterium]